MERIVATIPNFRSDWESFLAEWEPEGDIPWYVAMSELAHYIVARHAQGASSEFPTFFSTIEDILQNPDPEIDSLIAIGLFEDMQNIASHCNFGASPFRLQLGPRSLVIWDEVDDYMRRVIAWNEKQRPKWWQFWKKRKRINVGKALAGVQSPELRKIIEADFRKKT